MCLKVAWILASVVAKVNKLKNVTEYLYCGSFSICIRLLQYIEAYMAVVLYEQLKLIKENHIWWCNGIFFELKRLNTFIKLHEP